MSRTEWSKILTDLGWQYKSENCGCSGVKKEFWNKESIEMIVYPKSDSYGYKINGVLQTGKLSALKPVQNA